MKKNVLLAVAMFVALLAGAANDVYRYRVFLKDKAGVDIHSLVPPLSQEALLRRTSHSIAIDSTDYPVPDAYLASLRDAGFPVVTKSRWMNTTVVTMEDTTRLGILRALPFVRSVQLVWINPKFSSAASGFTTYHKNKFEADTLSPYGNAQTQVEMLGLKTLHNMGYKGKNITIAVLDAGFQGADTISLFDNIRIKAVRDFVQPPTTVYDGHYHGTAVLSQMAVNKPGVFMGTAPEATYCLLRSEENASEFPIEEDYWAAAAEYADSIGADVINSSLGYTTFDYTPLNYTQSQLDGKTAFITRVASIACSKGIFVVNSAGNEGFNSWGKIAFPADASQVLSVGAVMSGGDLTYFSSKGPTADGRIKPDVVALGGNNIVVMNNGKMSYGSGTSYAGPLIAGMVASIWSGVPHISAPVLRQRILESSDRFANPDTLYGYGLPNAYAAWYNLANALNEEEQKGFSAYPSAAGNAVTIHCSSLNEAQVCIYNLLGQCVLRQKLLSESTTLDVSALPASVYLIELRENGKRKSFSKIQIRR